MKFPIIFSLVLLSSHIFSHEITDRVTCIKEQNVFVTEYKDYLKKQRDSLEAALKTPLESTDKTTIKIIEAKISELGWEMCCIHSGTKQFERLTLEAMQIIWDNISKKSSNCISLLSSPHPDYNLYRALPRNLSFKVPGGNISQNREEPVSMTLTILIVLKK